MAQDYNIYLHATEENVVENKTKPSVNRTSTYTDGTLEQDNSILERFTKVKSDISSFASSGFESIAQQGIATLSKVFPIVAIAYAIFKLADSVTDTILTRIDDYTGYYEYSMNYNNFKAGIKNVIMPVSFAKRQIDLNRELTKQNIQIEQNRTLVGSATLRNIKIGI